VRSAVLRIVSSPLALLALACAVNSVVDVVRTIDAYVSFHALPDEGDALSASIFVFWTDWGPLGLLELSLVGAFALWVRYGAPPRSRLEPAWWVAVGVLVVAHFAPFVATISDARTAVALIVVCDAACLVAALLAAAMLAGRPPSWRALRAAPKRMGAALVLLGAAVVLLNTADAAWWSHEGQYFDDTSHMFGWVDALALAAFAAVAFRIRGRWADLAGLTILAAVVSELAYRGAERAEALGTAAAFVAVACGLAAVAAFAGIGVIVRLSS
jgi:hypothetical protein